MPWGSDKVKRSRETKNSELGRVVRQFLGQTENRNSKQKTETENGNTSYEWE